MFRLPTGWYIIPFVVFDSIFSAASLVASSCLPSKITTTQRTRHSEGSLQITVRDENGHIIWTDILKSNDDWYTDFTTYTGDERALSDSDRDEVNRKQEFPPSEEEIINCLTGDINNNLPYKIKDYFNRM